MIQNIIWSHWCWNTVICLMASSVEVDGFSIWDMQPIINHRFISNTTVRDPTESSTGDSTADRFHYFNSVLINRQSNILATFALGSWSTRSNFIWFLQSRRNIPTGNHFVFLNFPNSTWKNGRDQVNRFTSLGHQTNSWVSIWSSDGPRGFGCPPSTAASLRVSPATANSAWAPMKTPTMAAVRWRFRARGPSHQVKIDQNCN